MYYFSADFTDQGEMLAVATQKSIESRKSAFHCWQATSSPHKSSMLEHGPA